MNTLSRIAEQLPPEVQRRIYRARQNIGMRLSDSMVAKLSPAWMEAVKSITTQNQWAVTSLDGIAVCLTVERRPTRVWYDPISAGYGYEPPHRFSIGVVTGPSTTPGGPPQCQVMVAKFGVRQEPPPGTGHLFLGYQEQRRAVRHAISYRTAMAACASVLQRFWPDLKPSDVELHFARSDLANEIQALFK